MTSNYVDIDGRGRPIEPNADTNTPLTLTQAARRTYTDIDPSIGGPDEFLVRSMSDLKVEVGGYYGLVFEEDGDEVHMTIDTESGKVDTLTMSKASIPQLVRWLKAAYDFKS